ncbi:MAG: hypothetical protein B6243_10745, partial [Anaerolineaceae bacterium 4572_5.2]
MMNNQDLVTESYELGQKILEKRDSKTLKEHGQFLTPPTIAHYMAKQLGDIYSGARILEPAAGSGVLVFALIENLIVRKEEIEIWIDIYEIDAELVQVLNKLLNIAIEKAKKNGIKIHAKVYVEDFVLRAIDAFYPSLFTQIESGQKKFDFVISNPPYFKINKDDARAKATQGKINGHTNIYTLFMALSSKMLSSQGKASFIVPRSFCSGIYFSKFRRDFLNNATPLAIHLFQSRGKIFSQNGVLQENLVFTFAKAKASKENLYRADTVSISTSKNGEELESRISREIPFKYFLNNKDEHSFFRLPTGLLDEKILDTVDLWEDSLESYGLEVSTGRVVPFRSKELLSDSITLGKSLSPLLWMQHIKPYEVFWYLDTFHKPQTISTKDKSLLFENDNYVLLRRFSAKEDSRRLVAAPFLKNNFESPYIGFENHLNVIFGKDASLGEVEAIGISALLNSAIIDRYFRIVNGNTQVNATELRTLPLPPFRIVFQIGEKVRELSDPDRDSIEKIVFSTLRDTHQIKENLPLIKETRITMGKIEEAQKILKMLGLPTAQQNEISALTLLVLANLSEDAIWADAEGRSFRVHDILVAIKEKYGRDYAENTRETIRRQVLHQFMQAGVVLRNPDDPSLATNSPRTHYGLTPPVLSALQAYRSPEWENKRDDFIAQRGTLLDIYQKKREQYKVPLRIAEGKEISLSPGKHNELQAAVIEEFGPRFAPNAKLLYLGDTAQKTLVLETEDFQKIGMETEDHGKLPDIVLLDEKKNWLFLIEAVTSHGPVSPKRYVELEKMF